MDASPPPQPTYDDLLAEIAALRAEAVVRAQVTEALQHLGDGITAQTADGRLVYANESAARMLGFSSVGALMASPPASLVERFALLDADGGPFPLDQLPGRRVLAGEPVAEATVRFHRRDTGEERWSAVRASAICGPDGRVQYALNLFRDVTARYRSEAQWTALLAREALARREAEASERRYRELFENANDILYTIDLDGVITDINRHVEAVTGYSRDQLIGQPISTLAAESDPERLRDPLVRKLAGEPVTVYEMTLRRKDGTELFTEVSSRLLRDNQGNPIGVQGAARDISERVRTDTALRHRMRLATLAADVSQALTQGDTLRTALGACADALVRHLDAAFARIWTVDADGATLELQASAGLYTHLDGPHGRVPLGSLKIGLIAAERRPHLTNEVIGDPHVSDQAWAQREGMTAFAGYPLLVGNRLAGVVALFARHPLTDTDLEAVGSVANGIALGIERLRTETALRETAAARDQALVEARAALQVRDEFLSSITHDLRTPLTTMKGVSQLVARQARRGQPLPPEHLIGQMARIDASVDKMQGLLADLLDLTRLESGRTLELSREPTDLVALVRACVDDHRRATPEHAIRLAADAATLVGYWDRARIERVVTNLLSNALKYSPNGGAVGVRVTSRHDTAGDWAAVVVQDTGVGIPADDLPHIFERFYRAANVRGWMWGNGVGLAGARQIVEQHGGSIAVESAEGVGSTFTVVLPLDAPVE